MYHSNNLFPTFLQFCAYLFLLLFAFNNITFIMLISSQQQIYLLFLETTQHYWKYVFFPFRNTPFLYHLNPPPQYEGFSVL